MHLLKHLVLARTWGKFSPPLLVRVLHVTTFAERMWLLQAHVLFDISVFQNLTYRQSLNVRVFALLLLYQNSGNSVNDYSWDSRIGF